MIATVTSRDDARAPSIGKPGAGRAAYRPDIDGLRAWAVVAVILFHFGKLPNGFLGVDVFFVISGFLITGIIYKELERDEFSVIQFYLRRTRRIVPLALTVSLIAFGAGLFLMLPDDLENLAQSVIATNFFSNNILQAITTRNYWDPVNEFKPLMHTWSLGIEEQYYLLYPFLFLALGRKRVSWAFPILCFLAAASLILYLLPGSSHYQKFYFIFFRFWELAAGGLAAIWFSHRNLPRKWSIVPLAGLLLLFSGVSLGQQATLLITVAFSVWLVIPSPEPERASGILLQHPVAVGIGKISFSLYMWHQVLLAFARYAWTQDLRFFHLSLVALLTVVLSILTYFLVEKPCRNRQQVSTKTLLASLAGVFLFCNGASFYVYLSAGVLRDVPELGLRRGQVERNIHAQYNERPVQLDRDFSTTNKLRVLVIGDSFARDWVNVLLESQFSARIEISYLPDAGDHSRLSRRTEAAHLVFFTCAGMTAVPDLAIGPEKLWVVGEKNFGTSNGIFYNRRGPGYFLQRTFVDKGTVERNEKFSVAHEGRYVNLLKKVTDAKGTVPVFTPEGQFISQDCRHLTQPGARFFASLFEPELQNILAGFRSH